MTAPKPTGMNFSEIWKQATAPVILILVGYAIYETANTLGSRWIEVQSEMVKNMGEEILVDRAMMTEQVAESRRMADAFEKIAAQLAKNTAVADRLDTLDQRTARDALETAQLIQALQNKIAERE